MVTMMNTGRCFTPKELLLSQLLRQILIQGLSTDNVTIFLMDLKYNIILKPPSLSALTTMIFNMGLTH